MLNTIHFLYGLYYVTSPQILKLSRGIDDYFKKQIAPQQCMFLFRKAAQYQLIHDATP